MGLKSTSSYLSVMYERIDCCYIYATQFFQVLTLARSGCLALALSHTLSATLNPTPTFTRLSFAISFMDPLSVTLAVVSLATTVKDLVELGQKLHESFAKVSKSSLKPPRI